MWRYLIASIISFIFRSRYLFVPLYDLYCQTTGFRGTINKNNRRAATIININENNNNKPIKVTFLTTELIKEIDFKPTLSEIITTRGKPTLAFYTIKNNTHHTINGIRTYNVRPRKAAPFFHKIECFCFDEQRIKPQELLELPILFYIDSTDIDLISINYTFYKI